MCGYFMVMKLKQDIVIYSPLFWNEEVVYMKTTVERFVEWFKPCEGCTGMPIIQARYDHQLMRRLNILWRNK